MNHTQPTVSVSIVLYNSRKTILNCLESLKTGIDENFLDVILVDNCSPDDSYEIVKKFAETSSVNIIRAEKNLGFAGGMNFSFEHARGKYWLMLNPDAEMSVDDIKKMAAVLDENADIGAISPQIHDDNAENSTLSLAFPAVGRAFAEITRLSHVLSTEKRGQVYKIPALMRGDLCEVDWVPGTALMVRSDVVKKIGGLSEEFFMYAEDVEFCWRIRREGWKIAVLKTARVRHIGGVSSEGDKNLETIRRSIPNYFKADSRIIGAKRAMIVGILRMFSYGIESLHPLRPKRHRSASYKIFKENFRFLRAKLF